MANENRLSINNKTFWEVLSERAEITPDRLLFVEGENKKQSVTVSQFAGLVEKLAAGLYELGITAGTVVAWQMPTRLHTVVLAMALVRLGAVQNPILHLFRERELADILTQTKPEWIIVPAADQSCDYPAQATTIAKTLDAHILVLAEQWPQGDPANLPTAPNDCDQVRWYYCTSGTTSGPKAVMHTDATLLAGGHALAISIEANADDVTSIAYPVAHIGGAMVLAMLLEVGMSAVLIERFDIDNTAAAFRQHGVTMTGGSTAHYQAWLAAQKKQPENALIPTLRMLTGGGASKPPQLFFQTLETMAIPIVHAYGMTESPLVASNTPSSSEHALAFTDGKPVAGMDVRIQRADGSWADVGEVGEVVIKGNCVCKGYLNPQHTQDAFDAQGYYHTGDLARFDEDGYISLSGRLKDIIIRKGENISAQEIELLLMDYPGVKAVAVIGLPDEDRGERVCAVLEFEGESITLSDIGHYLTAKGLMKQKLPEQLEIIDCLPRSQALGKVSKKILQQQFA